MNILVIGGNGQLGREIRLKSRAASDIYYFPTSKELNILKKRHIEGFLYEHSIDIIVNCAAYVNVARAEIYPEEAFDINYQGVLNLAECIRELGRKLIHISTDYVYSGKNVGHPYREDDQVKPFSKYGESKLAGENAIKDSGCDYIILRVSWLYSTKAIGRLAKAYKRLSIHKRLSVDACQVGSLTYAKDIAEAIINIISNRKHIGNKGVYNCSNIGESSIYDYYKLTNDFYKCKCNLIPDYSVKHIYTALDSALFQRTFNVKMRHWTTAYEDALMVYGKSISHKCKLRWLFAKFLLTPIWERIKLIKTNILK